MSPAPGLMTESPPPSFLNGHLNIFLLWGYQQHQQNMILEQQIQIQNIELQHMRISLEQRPTSPKSFQEPYAIPANYIPNRIDL